MAEPKGQYLPDAAAANPGLVKAHGDVKTRIGVLWLIGIVCSLLIVGGFAVFLLRPESAKDVWVIIGPIISAAMSGTVSFLAAERAVKGDG
jgi:hypothetical protein